MKKFFTFCCLVMIGYSYSVTAQSTRLVLAEEFTNASCGPCAAQNPAFNTLLNANSTKVVAIKYQTDYPGVDPMNAQNPTMVDSRHSYYAVSGVPHACMDGVAQTGGSYTGAPANWSQTKLNTRAAITSPFDLSVSHIVSADYDSVYITVNITATGAVSGALKLHTALIERNIEFCSAPGSNGETEYEGVMRSMYPNQAGATLSASWTVGQTQTITYEKALPTYIYDKNTVGVVVFIQDDNTTDVKQAAYSIPQPMVLDAKLGCGNVGNPTVACAATWNPTLTLKNNGSTSLTAVTINYTIDGVPAAPYNWTGNLAPGATTIINLPQITPANGVRTIVFTVSGPNGQTDLNPNQDSFTATYYDYGSVGQTLPQVEAFAASTFPPGPDWRNVNPNAGAGWTRSTAGLNGGGSARMYFWGSATNQIDELWLPNVDLSAAGVTAAQIGFDLAHAQYNTSTDKMEVLYSIDCGQNWTSVYNKSGAALAMGNPASATSWTPSSPSQWHHEIVNLDAAVGNPSVFIKFKATSNNGNNCFIDNINVETNLTASVPVIVSENDISVYPNPSSGSFSVRMNLSKSEDVKVVISNALGATVRMIELRGVTSEILPVDLSNEAKGTYEVSVVTNGQVVTKRISITE